VVGGPTTGDLHVPRTIWFVWFQGVENGPEVVRRCHESWLSRNPGWKVVTLDEASLPAVTSLDYASGNLASQSPNHRSNLVRLELLARYGGVWADATCLCVRPLDEWLPANLGSGFFAFARPTADRLLSTWFLAASPANPLVVRLLERLGDYWGRHTFRDSPRLRRLLRRHLKRSARRRALWFSPLVRDVLRIAPYFAFHYCFEQVLGDDPELARIWGATPKVSADGPHRPMREGLLAPVSPGLRAEIDSRAMPIYKLSWKLGDRPIPPDSALGYLLGASAGRE
jgi:Capsular polysaccharide synthesis protein